MRCFLYTFLLICITGLLWAQPGGGGFTPKLTMARSDLPDSLLYAQDSSKISSRRVNVYRLSEKTGERYLAPMDTMQLNFANRTVMEGHGLGVSYLANIGSPAQSRIYSERNEENDFIFTNPYSYYITTPTNALFYDVKDPHTRIRYTRAGGQTGREEVFNGVLTTNFGKKINIGTDFDYTYVRGQYTSNANKLLYYRLFGNYLSDRYEMHTYFRNFNYLNTENGGFTNDRYITHTEDFEDRRNVDWQTVPTRMNNTWNRVKGKQFFLTHRYNLGFYREMTEREKEEANIRKELKKQIEEQKQIDQMLENETSDPSGEAIPPPLPESGDIFATDNNEEENDEIDAVFVPVSSIIHTFEYEDNSRRFTSRMNMIDTCYENLYGPRDSLLNDYTSAWFLKNTVALSLREGFQEWAKFGLTAFAHFEKRRFTLPSMQDSLLSTVNYDEFSTYLGGELTKRQGQLLTYNVRGEFCIAGSDIGEFQIVGDAKSQFRLLKKEATVTLMGHLKNMTPAFYTRHHHARYFSWDNSAFKKTQRLFVGGQVDVESTRTQLSAGVESIQNFIYYGMNGTPEQTGKNMQVVTLRLKQDFRYKALGWENELAYQISSDKAQLPLPQLTAYTNLYLDFTYAKVLRIQIGADAHYFTSYYAPYYEPATQQFQTQEEKQIGNYPTINAYVNFNLKQARFFVMGYNVGSLFITPKNYFSLLHYPLNPMMIKLGISVYFNH